VAEELGLPTQAEGVIAIGVDEMAAATGVQVGDIILAINGQLIETTMDVEASASQRSRLWQVDVTRQGQALRLRFRY
jgi:S1-C subfamily serine protease